MTHRREFIRNAAGAVAGLCFTSCNLLGVSSARAQATGKRREVTVAGRRAKVIDVHAHCTIPEAHALLGLKAESSFGPGLHEIGARRIREMDDQGIDMEVLSINPAWYRAERDLATEVIRIQNEGSPSSAASILIALPHSRRWPFSIPT